MNCMKYCPIYRTARLLNTMKSDIKYWWKYKVKKQPEPDPTETIKNLMPALATGMVSMIIAKQIMESIHKEEETEYETKEIYE